MKKLLFIFIILCTLSASCYDPTDPHIERPVIHGMKVGCDSMELGGKIFYIDTIQGYCLIALVSLETQFSLNCEYPTWCPYYRSRTVEKFRFICGLVDTICGGKINTKILFNEYGCFENSDCNQNNGYYGALCAETFTLRVGDSLFSDYWAANLREIILYAEIGGDPNWYMSTSQANIENAYTYNCRDKKIIIEPKSQNRLPLLIRRYNF